MVRGLAAILVLAGHLRAYLFQSYGELSDPGLLSQGFYFATGFGHQAVVVFFVLSGFLVGGRAFDDLLRARFSWPRYLLRRLTRLWIVVVPALLMTLVFDTIGRELTNGAGYDGRHYQVFSSGPREVVGIDLSLATLLGNVAFLQTITVPTFGSNGPLWSLANEFWYYIIFPLMGWLLLAGVGVVFKLAGGAVLIALFAWLPAALWLGGALWVAGAAAGWLTHRGLLPARMSSSNAVRLGALGIIVTLLALSKAWPNRVGDLELGLSIGLALPVIATSPEFGRGYGMLARGISEFSYTLYLTHFPLLTLIVLAAQAPVRMPPGMLAAGLYVGLFGAAIAWAAAFWWLFERNTDRVFTWLARGLPMQHPARVI